MKYISKFIYFHSIKCIWKYHLWNGVHFVSTWLTRWGRDKMDALSQTPFFKCIFVNENVWIPIKISLKFVSKGPINNIPPLVQIMAWRRPGDKPLSEPMMVRLLTHICVTRPQWVNSNQSICPWVIPVCSLSLAGSLLIQVDLGTWKV